MKAEYGFVIIVLVAVILSAECLTATVSTSDVPTTYQQPAKVSTYSQSTASTYSPPSATPTTTIPSIQTFRIGETATNGIIRITANSVNFNDKIKDRATHNVDYHWLTVDITFVNNDNTEIAYIRPYSDFSVTDSDGFTYAQGGYSNFEKQLFTYETNQVLPGETRRGNIYFEIPKISKNLRLKYNFGQGQIAVFNLG